MPSLSWRERRLWLTDALGRHDFWGVLPCLLLGMVRARLDHGDGAGQRRGQPLVGMALALLLGTLAPTVSPAVADAVTHVVPVGDKPGAIAVNAVTNKAYVASAEGVSVINGVTGAGTCIPVTYPWMLP